MCLSTGSASVQFHLQPVNLLAVLSWGMRGLIPLAPPAPSAGRPHSVAAAELSLDSGRGPRPGLLCRWGHPYLV